MTELDRNSRERYETEEALARFAAVSRAMRPEREPLDGIMLTPEEAGIAARGIREWLHLLDRYSPTHPYGPRGFRAQALDIADRLEKVAGR